MLKYYNDYFTLILNNPTLIFLNNKMFSFVLHTGVKVASIAKKNVSRVSRLFSFFGDTIFMTRSRHQRKNF